ncbi:MAG: D-alanine--D-alanine ligase [Oscillospiraceae bacterium]|nr:D-alanine--D-alanine ligase [Oscillospiraceae bacterium]
MNVIVLAGGYSPERDVSLVSGSKAAEALRKKGHKVLLLDPYLSMESCSDFAQLYARYARRHDDYAISSTASDLRLLKEGSDNGDALIGRCVLDACRLSDVVFIGLHGSMGENGQLQAALDLFGVKYTGSNYMGCLLSMDKTVAKEMMAVHGIRTPSGEEAFIGDMAPDELYDMLKTKKPPFIVKPANGGSSLGVTIVRNEEAIAEAIQYAKAYEKRILIEEYIAGREFTVGILDGAALPVIEIRAQSGFFDYKNKYQEGLTSELCPAPIPADLSDRLKEIALSAHKALRLGDYSRADFIVDDDGNIYCLEVNSLPGLTPASLVPKEAATLGMSYEDLCDKIVHMAMTREKD